MARKVYGGWAAFGEPEFDGSSVSGGKPKPSNSKEDNFHAANTQKKLNKVTNCRRCKPDKGQFCGKHAKNAMGH